MITALAFTLALSAGQSAAREPEPLALTPVLLVPGWQDRAAHLEPLRARFLAHGWPADAARAIGFREPVGSNAAHAAEIAAAVDTLRRRTGAQRVDIVAHSMGGLAVRYYLSYLGGSNYVRRVVFLATPHQGTWLAYLGWGQGGREMRPGSALLERLNRGRIVPAGVRAISIRTPADLRVFPRHSTQIAHALNLRVCCPSHPGLIRDRRAFETVKQALLDP
ncbi:MAG: alpha/beta fold hydrolase [Gemmatimonadetes bacterium]|nr:alpha/beta fold hydrolase [Gemmatimonadota bacterium]